MADQPRGSVVADAVTSADWLSAALRSSDYHADLAPGSLWEIDRFFDEHAADGRPRPGGLLAESTGMRLFAVGGYVGEVIRRSIGGTWIGDDNDPAAEVNLTLQLPDGTYIWPVQRAIKRLQNGPEDGIAVYAAAVGVPVGPRPERRVKRRWFRSS